MLQQEKGDDYVLATGETTLVRDFVSKAFREVGITLTFKGEGIEEQGLCADTGRVYVQIDPRYFRPTEVELLIGDPSKAREKLGWSHEIKWDALCAEMVREDMITVAREQRRNAE